MPLVHVLLPLRRLRRSARVALVLASVLLGAQALAAWHGIDLAGHADVERGDLCASCLAHGAGHAALAATPWLAPPRVAPVLPAPRPCELPPGHAAQCGTARGPPPFLAA